MASAPQSPPYGAYATIMGAFVGGLAVAGAVARSLDRDPRENTTLDLAVLGMATFKAARTITRDEVTSFIREPFVEGEAHEGGEQALETGDMRQAIGELVTCSRCVGTWAAAGLAAGALNDWFQAGFEALRQEANVLQQRADDRSFPSGPA